MRIECTSGFHTGMRSGDSTCDESHWRLAVVYSTTTSKRVHGIELHCF